MVGQSSGFNIEKLVSFAVPNKECTLWFQHSVVYEMANTTLKIQKKLVKLWCSPAESK